MLSISMEESVFAPQVVSVYLSKAAIKCDLITSQNKSQQSSWLSWGNECGSCLTCSPLWLTDERRCRSFALFFNDSALQEQDTPPSRRQDCKSSAWGYNAEPDGYSTCSSSIILIEVYSERVGFILNKLYWSDDVGLLRHCHQTSWHQM